MKILLATGIYPPEIGGPATYAALMEEELRRRGWMVEVLPFSSVRSLPSIIRHVVYGWKLWHLTRDAQVVFAQDTVSVGLPALCVAKLRSLPLVIRVPGDFAWEQGVQRFGVKESIDAFQDRRYGWRVELLRWIQRCVVRGADRVIAPSDYFATLVSGWVYNASRVQKMYNGVAVPAELAPTVYDRPTLITAARLVPWKGIETIIEAMVNIPEAQLIVVGEGPERGRLEAASEKFGVRERVVFTGALPRAELLNRIAGADIFVLGSSFESFSFQLVEAMMVGTPVVARDIGNLRELIVSGENGVLLETGDAIAYAEAIRALFADPITCQRLGTKAKQDAGVFSVEATGQALERLLLELVEKA